MMFHVEQNKKSLHFEAKDHLVTGESFQIHLDENKIIGKTIPVPEKGDIHKYYNSDQYLPHQLNKRNLLDLLYATIRKLMHRKKLKWMRGYLKEDSNVLDYGCGSGEFVKFLRSKSVNAYGYDPNIKFNVDDESNYMTNKTIWKNKKYDIIILWHVLEHTHDPFSLIKSLRLRLNKNGKIFIAIPNFKSYDSEYYGKDWAGYDLPRHLWHFSRKSICLIAKEYNFKIYKEKKLFLDSVYVSYLSEKHKSSCFPFILGSIIGIISIFRSFFTKESSSFLFIFKKL